MEIYEMIFHKSTDESDSLFYSENSEIQREHFLESMSREVDRELLRFRQECQDDNKIDLITLFEEVHRESHLYIETMKHDFMKNSYSEFAPTVYMEVKKRNVLDVN